MEREEEIKTTLDEDSKQMVKKLLFEFLNEHEFDQSVVVPPLKTLSTLVDNLVQEPFETKFRTIKKTNKSIQEKILKF